MHSFLSLKSSPSLECYSTLARSFDSPLIIRTSGEHRPIEEDHKFRAAKQVVVV